MFKWFKKFRKSETGQGMVEYGLILALVSVVAVGSLGGVGGKVSDAFNKARDSISGDLEIPEEPEEEEEEEEEEEVIVVSKDALNALIGKAEGVGEGDYDFGYDELQRKLAASIKVRDNSEATQDEVDNMEVELQEAIDNLKYDADVTDENYKWVENSRFGNYEVEGQLEKGHYEYIGSKKTVIIPREINGHKMTNYHSMFKNTDVEKVISDNPNVVRMEYMFQGSKAESLDVSEINTSAVTNMRYMFDGSNATSIKGLNNFNTSNLTRTEMMFQNTKVANLDLSGFNTSKVENMENMFKGSEVTTLNVSSFDTSKVTKMYYMFAGTKMDELDLSSFDVSNVDYISGIFSSSEATRGYARTQADADILNERAPSTLRFTVR